MDKEIPILIVEDIATDAEFIERELSKANLCFRSKRVETRQTFLAALHEFHPAIVLSDYNLPQFSGPEALRLLKQSGLTIPFILITGSLTEEVAVECMKEGAHDYILKTSLTRLPSAVLSALDRQQVEEKLRRSEDQLRMSQKLEAVGQLAGGVAHDFNNLLTVITGYSDLLLNRLDQSDDNRSKLEEIKKAAERATSLTRQLLAFSRKQVLQPKLFDLSTLVSDMGKMLQRLIGENVEISMTLGAGMYINADPGQIEQLLMNLVVNARDAMPNGGRITVETARIQLNEVYAATHTGVQPGTYAMLAVSDTGTGMDHETQKHIFEPFFTTKEHGKGTGLGLSTVYGIVKQSGGNIWVYSEPGQGTVFKIYLPIAVQDKVETCVSSEPLTIHRGTETILIVEDEPQIRHMAFEFLKSRGYNVLVSSDGLEALQLIGEINNPIDLLLTDVVMPHISGRDLAERVIAIKSDTKVLFMSGYTDDAIVHHGVLDPGTWFIQKPFALEALARRVREVLDSEEIRQKNSLSPITGIRSGARDTVAD